MMNRSVTTTNTIGHRTFLLAGTALALILLAGPGMAQIQSAGGDGGGNGGVGGIAGGGGGGGGAGGDGGSAAQDIDGQASGGADSSSPPGRGYGGDGGGTPTDNDIASGGGGGGGRGGNNNDGDQGGPGGDGGGGASGNVDDSSSTLELDSDSEGDSGGTGRAGGGAPSGAPSGFGGGGGGGGGGLVLSGHGAVNTNGNDIVGGAGGAGGGPGSSGNGGGGGAGLVLLQSEAQAEVLDGDNISGGDGGDGATGGDGGGGVFLYSGGDLDTEGAISGGTGGGAGGIGGTGGAGVLTNHGIVDNIGTIEGGAGGDANSGGQGGHGLMTYGGTIINFSDAEITGGAGGDSTDPSSSSAGGDAGAGLVFVDGADGGYLENAGDIRGGDGGSITVDGTPGAGGSGVVVHDDNVTIVNAGTMAGGLSGHADAADQVLASAVEITGNDNTLELRDGYAFIGNVVAGGTGNALALGGADDGNFDVSKLVDTGTAGATDEFVGFDAFEKTGTSTWTLTGTTAAMMPWTIAEGTLSISKDANLGDVSGALTFDGGTLRTTATTAIERAIVLDSAGGTFTVAGVGTTTTLGGSITGTGGLVKTGTGELILTAQNDYTGGTTVAEGILEVQADGALGSGPVRVDGGGAWTRLFFDGASAGDIELDIDDGLVFFRNGASAGSSTINIDQEALGASFVASTAGTANITVHNGSLQFGSSSSAGSATLTNRDGILFTDDSSAGAATFENQNGGQLVFVDTSTVASATIVNRSGGLVGFIGKSTADGATIVNEASGGIDLSGHSGHLGIGALSGNGDVYLGGNDLAIGALGNDGEIGGVIQDGGILGGTGGSLIKTGTGKLTLNGANTYTGGTSILGGSVQISEDANLGAVSGGLTLNGGTLGTIADMDSARSVTLSGTGAFEVASATTLGLTGAIGGTGDLLKRGEGTLVLTGTNAYEGDTLVDAGTLVGNAASIRGSIGNGATLVLDQADDAAFAGDIGGLGGTNGQMVKQGAGTLTLDGVSTLDWTVSEGGLETEAARFGGNVQLDGAGTALSFADSDHAAYDGTISGNGQFSLDGEGTVLLTGDSAGFAGSTAINAGMLLVGDANGNGTLGGSLHVLDGATIGGSGTIGSGAGSSVTVATGGSLSPGNSIGTLTVDGDLIFAAGSRLAVEVNPGGWESDLVAVTGTATLNGGAVAHIGANGNYDLRSTYTVLSAGELDGAFESVTSDFAFLNPDLIYDYDAGTVDLKLARNDIDFASTALTRNQIATAGGIESIGIVAGHSVYDAIAQLADDDDLIHASFDALSGEIHASAQTALIEDSRFVRSAANDRIRAAFATAGASYAPVLAYGPGDTPVLVSADHGGSVFWSHGFGSWGSTDSDDNAAELDRSSGGLLIGADSLVGDWRVGLLAGYSHSSFDAQDRASSGASSNYHLGLYGGTEWGNLAFRTGAAYTWHDIETSRSVSIPGLTDSLSADYTAGTFQAFGELGYGLDLGTDTRLEPFVNLAHVNLHTNGSTEQGGAAALSVESGTTSVTFTTLGVRGEHNVALGTVDATLRGIIGWRHAFGDTTPESIHAFSAGDALTIAGAPIARNSAVIEAGLDLYLTPEATFGFSYQGQIASDAYDHGFKANLAVRF